MLLMFGFLALLAVGYVCFKGLQVLRMQRSMGNQDWLRKKLSTDRRFSQAEKSSVLDESALAFQSTTQKIFLGRKEVQWTQSSHRPRKHNGWKLTIKEYDFADFTDAEEVDNDFQERHVLLCSRVRGQEVSVQWGHIDVVRALRPFLGTGAPMDRLSV